jgi:putative transposase
MPRIPRGLAGGGIAHVLSRGNARATVFHSSEDYEDFVRLLYGAVERFPVKVLAFCLMPNHFHLVLQFEQIFELSSMMRWLLTTCARRHHIRHVSSGHLWQGRFKSIPVQDNEYLLTLIRYVLVNPIRARLVAEATDWAWNSLEHSAMLAPWPTMPAGNLRAWLSVADEAGANAVREAIRRGTPFGDPSWREEAARAWGIRSTARPVGRPRVSQCDDASWNAESLH